MNFSEKLILALDFSNQKEALIWVDRLKTQVKTFKVGLQLFTHEGPSIVHEIHARGGRVFLDLKFHDIPNTIQGACESVSSLNIFMLNMHCCGGVEMMKAGRDVFKNIDPSLRPLLLGVTVLTSQVCDVAPVLDLASKAKEAGLDGVVCSVHEVPELKSRFGSKFLTVTPGIRLGRSQKNEKDANDQKRVSTVEEALKVGTDFMVLGRTIFQTPDPKETLTQLIKRYS